MTESARAEAASTFRGVLPLNRERLAKVRVPVDAVCCGCQRVTVKSPLVRDPRSVGSFQHACKACGSVQWHNTTDRLDGIASSAVFVRAAVLELADAARDDAEPDPDVLRRGVRAADSEGVA